MYMHPSTATCTPLGVSEALTNSGVNTSSTDVFVNTSSTGVSIAYSSAVSTPLKFPQQFAVDVYCQGCGLLLAYPMSVSPASTNIAPGSTQTITAVTGDSSYTGSIEFWVGGVLQSTVTASSGMASCNITSSAAGTVLVYAWASGYGWAEAEVTFT